MRSPPPVAGAAAMRRCRRESKLLACPHCRRIGWLIGHGFLRGYSLNGRDKRRRGRRFFCSNRNRRRGCGRTCSVLLSIFLFRRTLRAAHLWKLWRAAARSTGRKAGWESLGLPFCLETFYRVWRRLLSAQSRIRTMLHRLGPPPRPAYAADAIEEVRVHLETAFAGAACPIAAFQRRLGRHFLA